MNITINGNLIENIPILHLNNNIQFIDISFINFILLICIILIWYNTKSEINLYNILKRRWRRYRIITRTFILVPLLIIFSLSNILFYSYGLFNSITRYNNTPITKFERVDKNIVKSYMNSEEKYFELGFGSTYKEDNFSAKIIKMPNSNTYYELDNPNYFQIIDIIVNVPILIFTIIISKNIFSKWGRKYLRYNEIEYDKKLEVELEKERPKIIKFNKKMIILFMIFLFLEVFKKRL